MLKNIVDVPPACTRLKTGNLALFVVCHELEVAEVDCYAVSDVIGAGILHVSAAPDSKLKAWNLDEGSYRGCHLSGRPG